MRPHAWTVAAGVGALCSGAFVAGLLLAPVPRDGALAPASETWTVPTSTVYLEDERQVATTPVVDPRVPLTSDASGRVTRWECREGGVISSGTAPLVVDDRPVVALASDVPLWRELALGADGEDVRAIQAELERLGFAGPPSGTYDEATVSAVDTLLRSVGTSPEPGVAWTESVLWLPGPEVTVESCDVALGERVESGDRIATTAGLPTHLVLALPDARDLVAGARSVSYAGVTAEAGAPDAGGMVIVDDPAVLEAVRGGTDLASWQDEAELSVTLRYVLQTPVETVAVPPAALFALDGVSGCVRSGGDDRRVTVLASRLGQTMVVPGDGAPLKAVDRAPADPPESCA